MYGFSTQKLNSILHSGAIFFALFSSCAVAANIVKWVDGNGKTHYSDRMPDQEANRKNTVITTKGIAVKQNQAVDYQEIEKKNAQAKIEQEQLSKDRALLNSYTSENEIELAYQRTLEIDVASIQGLELNKRLAAGRMLLTQKKITAIQNNKRPVPDSVTKEMVVNQSIYNRLVKIIDLKKQEMAATKSKFEIDAARYKTLKAQTTNP